MPNMEVALRRFSFKQRPVPVPGDLRIVWRVALILMMLDYSRSKRASLAKLHIINDAVRSDRKRDLDMILKGAAASLPWNLRVEPAFARAVDFVVGEGLATWTKASGRAALQLTKLGIESAEAVKNQADALIEEREIISEFAPAISEGAIISLLGDGPKA
jgi:hypothetical protein